VHIGYSFKNIFARESPERGSRAKINRYFICFIGRREIPAR
jgi:hypothetical protein